MMCKIWRNGIVMKISLTKKLVISTHTSKTFVVVLYSNSNYPVYIIKLEEKGVVENEPRDRFCHLVFKGECYFKGSYLKKVRWNSISTIQFKITRDLVYVAPNEIHEALAEIDEKLHCQ